MSFSSKLFELLPDADYLLSLEPEYLAGPLLISLPKYARLTLKEALNMPLDLCVEKMRLSRDKTRIEYNDFSAVIRHT